MVSETVGTLIEKLEGAIPGTADQQSNEHQTTMTTFLESLFHWYSHLPSFSKYTARVSAETRELRNVLTSAVDPIGLVLSRMPVALGYKSLLDAEGNPTFRTLPALYVSKFMKATEELSHVFPVLVNELISDLAKVLESRAVISNIRKAIEHIDGSIIERIQDVTAKAFVLRAQDS